jgi:hypothetical protein
VLLLDQQQAHLPLICDSPAPDNKSSASSVTRIASPDQKFKKRSKRRLLILSYFTSAQLPVEENNDSKEEGKKRGEKNVIIIINKIRKI